MQVSLQNHFLIAMPSLVDTFFHHSVVYLCEHDENGAMGLIINRPSQVPLAELFLHLNIDNPSDLIKNTPVLFGGPVQKGQGMVLHDQHAPQWRSTIQLADDIYLTTSTDILTALGTDNGPKNALVTLGYAGWEAGQLEQEIGENSWLNVPATQSVLFDTPAEQCWEAAAQSIGIDINLMSNLIGHA